MKNIYIITMLLVSLLSWSCEEVPEFSEGDTVPVVEAFIYANEPVDNVVIKEVIPFGSEEEGTVFISGMDVRLGYDGIEYLLEEYEEQPGHYFYPGEDLDIQIGNTYDINFEFEGKPVFGQTMVPNSPEDVRISQDEISLPQIAERRDLLNFFQNNDINLLVEWDNLIGDYYYLVIQNTEENPESLDPNEVLPFNFEFTSQPTQDAFFSLQPFIHYTQYGLHRIIVYHVNEEYALLYQTLEQDSRDLNEPFSNITNGVGIFSAFASDTVYLDIVKQ